MSAECVAIAIFLQKTALVLGQKTESFATDWPRRSWPRESFQVLVGE
jgi:hypothetical protein